MSISVAQLENLLNKLERLTGQLRSSGKSEHDVLATNDPLVKLADDCEFMLPSPLTAVSLLETAERKITNVLILLERAKQHQEIPSDMQIAADNEDTLIKPASSL